MDHQNLLGEKEHSSKLNVNSNYDINSEEDEDGEETKEVIKETNEDDEWELVESGGRKDCLRKETGK